MHIAIVMATLYLRTGVHVERHIGSWLSWLGIVDVDSVAMGGRGKSKYLN